MIQRVHGRAAFAEFRLHGRRLRQGPLSAVHVPASDGEVRVAYALGRRVGSAVVRNRIRRRLRAAFSQVNASGGLPAGSYLVSASSSIANEPFPSVVSRVEALAAQVPAVFEATS